ncbi:zf-HC2 domain-containing protein [Micromonospora sp. DT43]|uniref:zf-HC2 domain-containing protein n=1 Tax=Micromonospora sp. DT43 TaxID=3393440 RepID=UPI003CF2A9D4
MSTFTCPDASIRTSVGLYVLGRLSERERGVVVAHLRECTTCRAERAEIGDAVASLGLLTEGDVRDLVADFGAGTPGAARGVPGDHLFGAPGAGPARARPVRAEPRPAGSARTPVPGDSLPVIRIHQVSTTFERQRNGPGEGFLPPRPTTGPLSRGPHSHRRPRSRRRRAGAAVGLTGLLALALSTALLLEPFSGADSPGPAVAMATTEDAASGVELSAVLYDDDGQVTMRVSTDGLAPGASYQLWAVTREGEELLLGGLNGEPGGGTYAGDVAVSVDDLSQLSVRQVEGGVLVTADVIKGSP